MGTLGRSLRNRNLLLVWAPGHLAGHVALQSATSPVCGLWDMDGERTETRQVGRGKLHETLHFFGMVLGETLVSAEGNTCSGSFPFYHTQKKKSLVHFVFAMYIYCCFFWGSFDPGIKHCIYFNLCEIAQKHSLT